MIDGWHCAYTLELSDGTTLRASIEDDYFDVASIEVEVQGPRAPMIEAALLVAPKPDESS